MMHRVPVVASRVGGMPYIVNDRETGFVVDPDNPGTLAQAICKLLGDRVMARRMGDAGRERAVAHFSWERATDLLLNTYEAALR
jgi:glycosyltransferase involved in cell wall biosynthesis